MEKNKIKGIAKLSGNDFLEVYELVLKNITVLNHSIIPIADYEEAIALCENIDIDDMAFVAFSEYLKCKLWTGDKKSINGLTKKGFKRTLTTNDLYKDFISRREK